MPDRDIPLQPEVPRPIPREEAELNEQTAWIDPEDTFNHSYERPPYDRPTYHQPTPPGQPRRTPFQGCQMMLLVLMLLFLLSCCLCNNTLGPSLIDSSTDPTIDPYGYTDIFGLGY